MSTFWHIFISYDSAFGKIYALLRWLMCPFPAMEQAIPLKGKIFDLGCGIGVFSQYLALTSKQRQVIGIDTDRGKIQLARKAGKKLKNLHFKQTDVFKVDFKSAMGVILSDFLHHLSFEKQDKLLRRVAKQLKKSGVLVIKEINKDDLIRSKLSRFWDFLFYPQDKIYYQSLNKLAKKIANLGFSVEFRKEILYFPGSTNLLICRKTDKYRRNNTSRNEG